MYGAVSKTLNTSSIKIESLLPEPRPLLQVYTCPFFVNELYCEHLSIYPRSCARCQSYTIIQLVIFVNVSRSLLI